jgi:hypothetical protein
MQLSIRLNLAFLTISKGGRGHPIFYKVNCSTLLLLLFFFFAKKVQRMKQLWDQFEFLHLILSIKKKRKSVECMHVDKNRHFWQHCISILLSKKSCLATYCQSLGLCFLLFWRNFSSSVFVFFTFAGLTFRSIFQYFFKSRLKVFKLSLVYKKSAIIIIALFSLCLGRGLNKLLFQDQVLFN